MWFDFSCFRWCLQKKKKKSSVTYVSPHPFVWFSCPLYPTGDGNSIKRAGSSFLLLCWFTAARWRGDVETREGIANYKTDRHVAKTTTTPTAFLSCCFQWHFSCCVFLQTCTYSIEWMTELNEIVSYNGNYVLRIPQKEQRDLGKNTGVLKLLQLPHRHTEQRYFLTVRVH